ncbi:MAG: dihydrodipicolinate synthase family protein [Ignavibacteriae bacterium]|nr:dihydrodipicolinate synthase family protein [Ignavibacteriota bacterium]
MELSLLKSRLKGVLPPMVTPFTENSEVDHNAFVANLALWNSDSLTGYLVLGSNSEAAYLTLDEKLKLIELTVQHAASDRIVLAGTGVESTNETIELTNAAAQRGVHAALVLTPHYYGDAMTDEVLIRFFTEVADNSKIPILVYNVPKFTHVNVSVNVVETLSRHPNIVGMKDSAMGVNQLHTFYNAVPPEFTLMVGSVGVWLPALEIGIRAGVHAAANCLPNQCTEIQHLYEKGLTAKAKELQERMSVVNKAVTVTYGIAGLKYATTLMGYNGGYPRRPLQPLNEQGKTETKRLLREMGFLPND